MARGLRDRLTPLGGWWWLALPMLASAWVRELWAPDEPRYAEVAREIFDGGSWLVMHLCGELYPDKPPLLFWLAGVLGWLSSWSELAMRLPSIAATLGTAWVIGRLARRWWGEVEAAWAPVLFLTTTLVVELGGRLQIDPLLSFLCVLALELVTRPELDPRRRSMLLITAGLLLGLGALAKGPVAYLHVLLVVAAWRLLAVHEAPARVPRWVWLATVAAAVAPPLVWALSASVVEPRLLEALFFDQHLGRVVKADRHPGPVWKHLTRLPFLLLPWTLLVAAELARVARRWRDRAAGFDAGSLRAALWLLSLVVFFSLIPPKRDLYLLPAYPAAALLAARALTRSITEGRLARWIAVATPLVLGLAGLALSLAGLFDDRLPGLAWRAPAVGVPLLVGAVLALRWRAWPQGWAIALAWSFCVATTLAALAVFSPMNTLKSGRELALELAALPQRPQAIPCIVVHPEAYRFYGGVPAVSAESLDEHLARDGEDFVGLVLESFWDAMPEGEQQRYRILRRRPVGGKEILVLGAASSPPDAER